MAKQPPRQTRTGLLSEARRLILPAGITSTGAPAILAVARQLRLNLDDWQADIVRVMFAKTKEGRLASEIVAMSIPRQAGKTYLVAAVVFAYCLVRPGVTVAWTAHHHRVMSETFASLRQIASQQRVSPHIRKVNASNENRSILFANGSRIVMAARESGALRGVANVAILVLDEAQILTENALSDILPTQNVAANPLTIMMGTPPRPKDPGEVFTQQREQAIAAEKAGQPLEDATWIEFSADPEGETDDKDQWRKANPSYPKRTPLRAIRKLRKALTEDHFRREALGIWDDKATPSVIPASDWDACADGESKPFERFVLALEVSPERERASVALAGIRADGRPHVELYRSEEGTAWCVDWIADRYKLNEIAAVVVDPRSPAGSLLPEFKKAKVKVVEPTGDDVANACAEFYDAATSGLLRHTGQPQLTHSLNSARRRSIGDRWVWNRKSTDSDITPIVAATLAVWGTTSRKVKARTSGRTSSGRRGTVG